MNTSMRRVNVIFLAVLLLSMVMSLVGPLATRFSIGGAWLFFWPLAFWVVRFLAFFVFPAVALVLAYIKYRRDAGSSLAYVNLLVVLALVGNVVGVESWATSRAKSDFAKESGSYSQTNTMNRDLAGQSLPALLLLDSSGQPVDVRDQIHAAPATLVVFFATYDVPWSDNVKKAAEIHRTMARDGVLVLGINEQESQETLNTFIAKQQADFPIFRDSDGKYMRTLGLFGSVEQMLVVDRSGKVITRRTKDSESFATIKEAILAEVKKGEIKSP